MVQNLSDIHGTGNGTRWHSMNRGMNRTTRLRILQLNLKKSLSAHLKLINDLLAARWDVILIQELYITYFSSVRTLNHFTAMTPTSWLMLEGPVWSTIWVNSLLSTNSWKILDVHNMNNIIAIELNGKYGNLKVFSIYNACNNSNTLIMLREYMHNTQIRVQGHQECHILWGGDFNWHHPMWDRDEDMQLFTNKALEDAEDLITLIMEQDMVME